MTEAVTFRPLLWPLMTCTEEALADILQHATAEQLVLLHRRFKMAVGLLVHARVAREAAEEIVTRGIQAYEAALDAPERPTEAPVERRHLDRVMQRVYRERFGADIPLQEPDPKGCTDLVPEPKWEDELWKVIDTIGVGVPPADSLSGYTRSDLVRLDMALRAITERMQPSLEQAIGDRAGYEWTEWAIGHGKEALESYLRDPGSAPDQPPGERIFGKVLNDEYVRRYGDIIPALPMEAES
jgi:hypothetical protein